MSIKSRARRLGRMIRRITGIHLPTAMKIGKLVAQGRESSIKEKFPELCEVLTKCQCCGPTFILSGKKGSIESGVYCLTENSIVKEYGFFQKSIPVRS